MDLEYLSPLEIKLSGATGELVGYGSTFGNVDLQGDIVAPGAFTKSLAEHAAAQSMPAMLWAHDPGEPIGVWTEGREDEKGLLLKGKLTLDTKRGGEARSLARDGALALSIGFQTRDADYENGRRVLRDLKLFEVSLVSIPANPSARITAIKSAVAAGEKIGPRDLERALHEVLGLPKQFARALMSGGYGAATNRSDSEGAVGELVDAVKANTDSLQSLIRSFKHGT